MDSIDQPDAFKNQPIDLAALPKFQEVEFNPVSAKLLTKNILEISLFALAAAGFFIYMFSQPPVVVLIKVFAVAACLLIAWLYFNAWKMQKVYGYCLREKDIIYRRGYLVTKTTVVSFNRIQHVSISQGVADKLLKISTLKIFTAGGSGSDISIPGLEPQMARRLKEALVAKIKEDEGEEV